jgi:hypothetical protein
MEKPPPHRFYCDICHKDHHTTEQHQSGCLMCGSMDVFIRCRECKNLVCTEHLAGVMDEYGAEDTICVLCYSR